MVFANYVENDANWNISSFVNGFWMMRSFLEGEKVEIDTSEFK